MMTRRSFPGQLVCLLLAWLALGVAALAQTGADRVALVIGNAAYRSVSPLANPANDAQDLGAALARLGFRVTTETDLDGTSMNRALGRFAREAAQADMAVLFFAGHGMEIDSRNYLVPVDAEIESALDVAFQAIDLSKMLQAVEGAQTLRLVLLDACRDNPFLQQIKTASRSLPRGLAQIEPPGGVLVGYAARGGTVAYDGDGRNSPYTKALLEHLEQPGLEIGKLFRQIRDTVYRDTGGRQEPFTYGSLPASDIYLAGAQPAFDPAAVLADFARTDLRNTAEAWREFLGRWDGTEAEAAILDSARRRLAAMEAPPPAAPAPTPAPAPVPQPAPQAARPDDSPLIRACDRFAADPEDDGRPEGIGGVAIGDIDLSAAATSCQIAVAGHPDHARSLYNLGRVHEASDNWGRAVASYKAAADMGYTAAQTRLGSELVFGSRIEPDVDAGLELLRQATENGSTTAPRYLGDFFAKYGFYRTEKQDSLGRSLRAIDYYRIAAERGDVEALHSAGYRLLSDTLSSDEDKALGLQFLTTAAEAGNRASMVRLGSYYLKSEDAAERRKAIDWFATAARQGNSYSIKFLVSLYKSGRIIPPDPVQAAKWAKIGADHGYSEFFTETGYNYEIGRGFVRDPQEAAKNYARGLEAGDRSALRRRPEDWDRDTARALQWQLRISTKAVYKSAIDGIVGQGTRAAMNRLAGGGPMPAATLRFSEKY